MGVVMASSAKPDKATVSLCYAVLKSAMTELHNTQLDAGGDEGIKSALAKTIIEHAASGERDPRRLRASALRKYLLQQWNC
jgi:hypothetical protein